MMRCRALILRSSFKAGALREALKVLQSEVPIERPVVAPVAATNPLHPAGTGPAALDSVTKTAEAVAKPVDAPVEVPKARIASPSRDIPRASVAVERVPVTFDDVGWSQDWAGFLEMDPVQVREYAAVSTDEVTLEGSPAGTLPAVAAAPHPAPPPPAPAASAEQSSPKKRKIVFDRLPSAVQLSFEQLDSDDEKSKHSGDSQQSDDSVISIDSTPSPDSDGAPKRKAPRVLPEPRRSSQINRSGRGRRAFSVEVHLLL
jgi:hypothetical protein